MKFLEILPEKSWMLYFRWLPKTELLHLDSSSFMRMVAYNNNFDPALVGRIIQKNKIPEN